jgi:hypothetical protein
MSPGRCKPAHLGVFGRLPRVTHDSALPAAPSLHPPTCLVFAPWERFKND